jgi:hypothetical protein
VTHALKTYSNVIPVSVCSFADAGEESYNLRRGQSKTCLICNNDTLDVNNWDIEYVWRIRKQCGVALHFISLFYTLYYYVYQYDG